MSDNMTFHSVNGFSFIPIECQMFLKMLAQTLE